MTTKERELVMDMATQNLSQADFLRRCRNSTDGRLLCGDLLQEALQTQIASDVECALMVGFTFGFMDEHLSALLELAAAPWHFKHEDVIRALGKFQSPEAVSVLYATTRWIPEYLGFDESRALAVKAIWGIGRIEGPDADAALKELMNDPDPILAKTAAEQMIRRRA